MRQAEPNTCKQNECHNNLLQEYKMLIELIIKFIAHNLAYQRVVNDLELQKYRNTIQCIGILRCASKNRNPYRLMVREPSGHIRYNCTISKLPWHISSETTFV